MVFIPVVPEMRFSRPSGVCVVAPLSPLRGLRISHLPPHGLRRGCILTPLSRLAAITRTILARLTFVTPLG
jgi:hypothetical protein